MKRWPTWTTLPSIGIRSERTIWLNGWIMSSKEEPCHSRERPDVCLRQNLLCSRIRLGSQTLPQHAAPVWTGEGGRLWTGKYWLIWFITDGISKFTKNYWHNLYIKYISCKWVLVHLLMFYSDKTSIGAVKKRGNVFSQPLLLKG